MKVMEKLLSELLRWWVMRMFFHMGSMMALRSRWYEG